MNWKLIAISVTCGFAILIILNEVLPSGFNRYLPIFAGGFCAAFIYGKKGHIFGGIIALTTIVVELTGLYLVVGGFHAYGYEFLFLKVFTLELTVGLLGGWMGVYGRNWLR